MDRRGFFGRFAAMLAAPLALGKQQVPTGNLSGKCSVDAFKATFDGPVMINRDRYFPHECEWRDLPERPASQCLVCGDVRSRLRYQQDMLDVVGEMSPKDTLLNQHLDAMWNRPYEFIGYDLKTGKRIWKRVPAGTSAP